MYHRAIWVTLFVLILSIGFVPVGEAQTSEPITGLGAGNNADKPVTGSTVTQQASGSNNGQSTSAAQAQNLMSQAQQQGTVQVIVTLSGQFKADSSLSAQGQQNQRNTIAGAQSGLLSSLGSTGTKPVYSYKYVPKMALEVDAAALQILLASPDVSNVAEDEAVPLAMASALPITNADDYQSSGFTGENMTIAVLDTGVQNNHPYFMDGNTSRVVEEACFNSSTFGAQTRCPNGQDEMTGPGAAADDCEDCGHGTHVAGIAAGDDPDGIHVGVAPDANIIAVNVFSDFPQFGSVLARNSDIIAGLEYVYDLRNTYNIAAANMSLGGGQFTSYCNSDPVAPAVNLLYNAGIATFIASGNDSSSTFIGSPGCIENAVTVGATQDNDTIAYFSNMNALVDVMAPGVAITSAYPTSLAFSGERTLQGTSMATPYAAGAYTILKEAYPQATVNELVNALVTTGVPIADTRPQGGGGVTRPRIDVTAADFALSTPALVTNDLVEDSTRITRNPFSATLSTANATDDLEPSCGFNVSNTVWYQITPGTETLLQANTSGSSFDTVLSLWTGPLNNLTEVACNDDIEQGNLQSAINYIAAGNTTYYIQVGGLNGSSGTLRLTARTSTRNDAPGDAIDVTNLLPYSAVQSTVGAATDILTFGCPFSFLGADVFYTYTPSTTDPIFVDTYGSDFDTQIAGFLGNPAEGGLFVGCFDDVDTFNNQLYTSIVLTPTPDILGQTFYFQVGGYQNDAGNLSINFTPPMANDTPAGATVISSNTVTYSDTLRTTSANTDVQTFCDNELALDVFYRYTAPTDGTLIVDTLGSDFDTQLAIFDRLPTSGTAFVACDDNIRVDLRQSRVILPVTAGTTYYMQAGGWQFAFGNLTLNLEFESIASPELDLNNDGFITASDGVYVVNRIGTNDLTADLDGDNDVDTDDYDLVGAAIGMEVFAP